jgi:hypothetical protein
MKDNKSTNVELTTSATRAGTDVISSVCDCNNRKNMGANKRGIDMCGNCYRPIAN